MPPIGGIAGENNPCHECGGTGRIDGEFHYPCLGTGYRGGLELHIFLKELRDDTIDKLNDIEEKCNEIKVVVDAL